MIIEPIIVALSCWLSLTAPCAEPTVAGAHTATPTKTGESLDVVLTARAALAWDLETGKELYAKNADTQLPIASMTKLFTSLLTVDKLPAGTKVEVTAAAVSQQARGADVKLPQGHTVDADQLFAAALIPSANDATVALVDAAFGDEENFVTQAAPALQQLGFSQTKLANATGLQVPGVTQHSTAHEVQRALLQVYRHPRLAKYLAQARGTIVTDQGKAYNYFSTNDLLGTYLPIFAAKTGYTVEAKENVTLITETDAGQQIGLVLIGSDQRFQDAKILAEWVNRNYTWK